MITHKIEAYGDYVAPAPPPPALTVVPPYVSKNWPYPENQSDDKPALPAPPGWQGKRSPSANKLEYAQFLNNMPFKVGDYVISRRSSIPLKETDYHRVVSIQEIHYLVKDDELLKEPMCIEVKDHVGNRWYTIPSKWFKANSTPIDIPLGM